MTTSINVEKAFNKVQHPFMIKTLSKVILEGTHLNIIRPYMKNPQLTSYALGKPDSFSSKIRNKARMSTLTTFIQHSTRSPSHSNQTRKRNKRYPNP
uniref:Reverse transcriptase domain-containing protein n=1 Tax=Neovison vison TaxID=452646 RepID=A0A8C7ESZ5_NEOVI